MKEYADDTALMSGLRDGEADAFEVLFNRYWKPLYLAAFKRLHNREEAEDIVQELLASVWRRRYEIQLNNDNPVSAYLFSALRYRIISFYAGVRTERFYGDVLGKILEIKEEDYFAHLMTRELQELLQQEIDSMPDNMKQVYLLTRENDFSIKEAAMQANLSEQTVKNLITSASRRLRTRVEQYYSDQSPQTITILLLALLQ
ncbi:MAG: sigma-70 family RNA polymerase sigma factor [Candidatus Pseudobacter hemicellulosilyticus]|uniref:Sigma-70 family RNA polymerase sigma factor n=1 Tax=Candidatus Pseudobacter hemicellulosilyticus TaxID=3121375 RepID=A0AAJ5WRB8_9BACT|nr:MAG: sigma-70 family RNA polymerase sigma factor [Pseudobacter sp.]